MRHLVRKIKDKEGYFRLVAAFSEDAFTLTVLKGANAYHTIISNSYLKDQAKLLKRDLDVYYENLKQYIQQEDGNVSVKFAVEQRVLEVHYVIGSGSSVRYFFAELQEINYQDYVEDLIDTLSINNTEVIAQVGALNAERELLTNELKKHKTKMEEFVSAKRLSDKQMLSNFVILLNEKKSRIQYLTELLEAFKGGREPVKPCSKRTKKNDKTSKSEGDDNENNKKPKKEVISDSDESNEESATPEPMEEDYNSEEEKLKRAVDLAIPSTSKADLTFLEADSPTTDIKVKYLKKKAASDDKNYCLAVKNKTDVEKPFEPNSKTQTEEVTVASTLDFNTQDMLDEL